jgi:GTP-binding protein YchF
VGLPNVGKSTLLNALSKKVASEAANYPFCTIEPTSNRVFVPDERLEALASCAGSQQIIPATLDFVDIAGLVKGASKGEGLGNQFLSHIREVDLIVHVLRCFESGDIVHVEQSVDPVRDKEIIETELMLADLESLERRIPALEKKMKHKSDSAQLLALELMKQVQKALDVGNFFDIKGLTPEETEALRSLNLLTTKPVIYALNVGEGDLHGPSKLKDAVLDVVPLSAALVLSADIEASIALLPVEEQKEFLESVGLERSSLETLVQKAYETLGLCTFFTVGPKEARAWTIPQGTKAPAGAGKIHEDFARGFIAAEVLTWQTYLEHKGEQGAKAAGRLRLEGKDYTLEDGDVVHFRFNV